MNNSARPEITVFIAASADGRLISQDSNEFDANKSWKRLPAVQGIISQFFDFSNEPDVFNVCSSDYLLRMGINNQNFVPKKSNLRLLVLDFERQISHFGLVKLAGSVDSLIVVQPEGKPGSIFPANCRILTTAIPYDLAGIAGQLKSRYHVKKLTVQSAGTMNSEWLQSGIVDHLTVLIYPLLIGNNGTPALIHPEPFLVRPLKLVRIDRFDNNYVSLQYDISNETEI
jgi:riboflavin biosynthesis pyrimidine reductase